MKIKFIYVSFLILVTSSLLAGVTLNAPDGSITFFGPPYSDQRGEPMFPSRPASIVVQECEKYKDCIPVGEGKTVSVENLQKDFENIVLSFIDQDFLAMKQEIAYYQHRELYRKNIQRQREIQEEFSHMDQYVETHRYQDSSSISSERASWEKELLELEEELAPYPGIGAAIEKIERLIGELVGEITEEKVTDYDYHYPDEEQRFKVNILMTYERQILSPVIPEEVEEIEESSQIPETEELREQVGDLRREILKYSSMETGREYDVRYVRRVILIMMEQLKSRIENLIEVEGENGVTQSFNQTMLLAFQTEAMEGTKLVIDKTLAQLFILPNGLVDTGNSLQTWAMMECRTQLNKMLGDQYAQRIPTFCRELSAL